MKSSTTGAVSGCIVWVLVFAILGTCVFPVALVVGGITAASNFAVGIVGPMVCPKETIAQINTYATTSRDSNGYEIPSTGYEIQCMDSSGQVVHTDPVGFAFIWDGILLAAGVALTALLAFLLATPAGILIGRMLGRKKPATT